MKKVKISPNANVVSVATLRTKFERLAANIGDNGLTPNFQYIIIANSYGVKSGINPQTNKPLEYPIIKAVKIGTKSNKVSGLSDLSVNSLKRTVNIDETTADVVDFSSILPNCMELNSLQLLEHLPADKMFAVVPNGTLLASTNFDTVVRPRQVYKVVEFLDAAKINEVLDAAISAGLIEEETETETEKATETEK